MLQALDRLGAAHWAIDVGPALPGHTDDLPAKTETPPPGVPLVLHVNPPMLPLVVMRLPRHLTKGRKVIGYWSWELPSAAPDWRIGRHFVHEVWVPSAFSADAIEPICPGGVHIVPHPLALVPPMPSALDRTAFGFPEKAVVVLVSFNLASSFQRKNPLAAIAAFRSAFGNRTDRLLVLKIANERHFPDDFARIEQAITGVSNIRLENRVFPTADAHALTAACDIVLSLHRSEGFGLVLAEAMMLGKAVVATGWSGNMSFMDGTSAALIGYRLVDSVDPREVYKGDIWAEPDVGEAAAVLKHLAADAEARARLGARGRATASARLSGDALVTALKKLGVAA